MSVPAIGSESFFLTSIWIGSLVLSEISLIVIIVLIFRRVVLDSTQKKQRVRKKEINTCFYAAFRSPVQLTAKSLPPVYKADYPLIVRCALDILRSMRGEDIKKIVDVLELWDLEPYVQNLTQSVRKGRQIQALTLLSYFSNESSLNTLLTFVSNRDMYVQIAALRGLARRGAIQHIGYITRSLARSGQTNTLILSDILHRFGGAAVSSLIELAKTNTNSEIRLAAIMALGSIGSLDAVNALIELVDDPDADIRAQSIAALGKIGDKRAGEVILRHLETDDTPVRVQAAQALGNMQMMASLPKLAAHLADDDWWVRFRAAESLYRFGDKGIAALKAFAGQQTPAGLISRQVLGELGGVNGI
jgi:hypothetical protein